MRMDFSDWSQHQGLKNWIKEVADLCQPKSVRLCDGSDAEYKKLCELLVDQNIFVRLNEQIRHSSYWCASSPSDVARIEERTFICSEKKEDAGPTNNWSDPKEMKATLKKLFHGCMEGREMYVVPFSMGPYGSELSVIGVEITDSPYVVVNMQLMTRMGKKALEVLGDHGNFIPCLHSVGKPLKEGEFDESWPCSETKYIVHFPEEKSIWSYGSGYGGNALLGKKCLALRIASVKAKEEGWLAEHMLILGLTNPQGEKIYVVAAFPSACGKTNLAMLSPALEGWKIECVGDDIAWMKFGFDGRLYAINPENGFFGVAPGTSLKSNPNAMKTIEKNTIFTNVGLTSEGDVWWEGMGELPQEEMISWKKEPWNKKIAEDKKETASHGNARFTVSARQCPIISQEFDNPNGVPISAIIFGGRRAFLEPLVYEAFDWNHGTFLGATLSSEMTAAAKGVIGQLRNDPFAMLPFCGYHMGDYFAHWIKMGENRDHLPKIFHVNWFKKDHQGKFLWPGFGDNIRVLKWIFSRVKGEISAEKTAIGLFPKKSDLDLDGLNLSQEELDQLLAVDPQQWLEEVGRIKSYFDKFGKHLPNELNEELTQLSERLSDVNAIGSTKGI